MTAQLREQSTRLVEIFNADPDLFKNRITAYVQKLHRSPDGRQLVAKMQAKLEQIGKNLGFDLNQKPTSFDSLITHAPTPTLYSQSVPPGEFSLPKPDAVPSWVLPPHLVATVPASHALPVSSLTPPPPSPPRTATTPLIAPQSFTGNNVPDSAAATFLSAPRPAGRPNQMLAQGNRATATTTAELQTRLKRQAAQTRLYARKLACSVGAAVMVTQETQTEACGKPVLATKERTKLQEALRWAEMPVKFQATTDTQQKLKELMEKAKLVQKKFLIRHLA